MERNSGLFWLGDSLPIIAGLLFIKFTQTIGKVILLTDRITWPIGYIVVPSELRQCCLPCTKLYLEVATPQQSPSNCANFILSPFLPVELLSSENFYLFCLNFFWCVFREKVAWDSVMWPAILWEWQPWNQQSSILRASINPDLSLSMLPAHSWEFRALGIWIGYVFKENLLKGWEAFLIFKEGLSAQLWKLLRNCVKQGSGM